MKIGLVGPTYQERSLPFDAQRTINFFPVFDPNGKEVSALYGTPGLELFATCGLGPIRQHFTAANGRSFVVSGSELRELQANGTSTLLGSLDSSSGNVIIDENGFQLGICDGASFYIYTYATNIFQKIINPNIPNSATTTFIDGYFVVNRINSGQFNISSVFDGTSWAALDFATAESSPDSLLRVINAVGQLWLFGSETTEIWTNNGSSRFPFERISGGKMEVGIVAPHSAFAIDNSVIWLGRDKRGDGIVFRANGFTPQRISTHAIEIILQKANNLAECRGWAYQQDGHTFYALTGGGLQTTLVYDLSTGLWHERAYLNANGDYEQHLAATCSFAFGKTLVGDRRNGKIYELKTDAYSDAGEPLASDRIYTHLSDEGKQLRFSKLEIGIEQGIGLQTGQGSDPIIMMRLSKDGGRTWSDWYQTTMGRAGNYKTKAEFRRLGIAEIMTFQIRITDPVKRAICGSYLS